MRGLSALVLASGLAQGCSPEQDVERQRLEDRKGEPSPALIAEVRDLAAAKNIGPLDDPPAVRAELVELGRALAFDKELSGRRNISCMTCHLPKFGTGDARSLSMGEDATGFAKDRVHPGGVFIPRNAPPLFNLHAMDALFWDGRVAKVGSTVVTPAGNAIKPGMQATFEFGAISALGMFPVTNRAEMRGATGTNELADLSDSDFTGIWAGLMTRLGDIPAYVAMFEAAYPGTDFEDMTFAHASNAMAGFFVSELAATDTKWDRFLHGDDDAMSANELMGAKNFLVARCHICHGGDVLSDNAFHNVALAQFGPGQGNGPSGKDDFGRMNVTGNAADKYAFRSTPLRNVELTGPYGHAGEFSSLKDFVGHYSDSAAKLNSYDMSKSAKDETALHATLLDNKADVLAARDPLLEGVVFDDPFRDRLTDFMKSLTDGSSKSLDDIVPSSVPSGLSIDDP
jgi:cytochrome c peroxidase